ncbi:MAG: calcium/sodium antiporter [Bacteroidales bacterium]|nr:calcium/sodium antiporter [Bacteroidales bacterium]
MLTDLLLLSAGLLLVILGADFLVDGASAIARRFNVSEFVIGLTIVGFGTSCPELVVSATGAIGGNSDISIGNVIGSNVFNTLLILGITALIMPITVTRNNKHRDIPIAFLVTLLMAFCGMSKTLFGLGTSDGLSRVEGIVFLALFVGYIFLCFKTDEPVINDGDAPKYIGLFKAIILVLAGLAGLVFGGQWFVDSAVSIAQKLRVSDKFIAITLLAGGTSLPELATCIVASVKKRGQLALGNILGSNIFNILLILGCSATIMPLSFAGVTLVDLLALAVGIAMTWLATYTFKKDIIDRYDGILMLGLFAAYYVWLFMNL